MGRERGWDTAYGDSVTASNISSSAAQSYHAWAEHHYMIIHQYNTIMENANECPTLVKESIKEKRVYIENWCI